MKIKRKKGKFCSGPWSSVFTTKLSVPNDNIPGDSLSPERAQTHDLGERSVSFQHAGWEERPQKWPRPHKEMKLEEKTT